MCPHCVAKQLLLFFCLQISCKLLSSTNSKLEPYWERGYGKCDSQLLFCKAEILEVGRGDAELRPGTRLKLSGNHNHHCPWSGRDTEQVLNFTVFGVLFSSHIICPLFSLPFPLLHCAGTKQGLNGHKPKSQMLNKSVVWKNIWKDL